MVQTAAPPGRWPLTRSPVIGTFRRGCRRRGGGYGAELAGLAGGRADVRSPVRAPGGVRGEGRRRGRGGRRPPAPRPPPAGRRGVRLGHSLVRPDLHARQVRPEPETLAYSPRRRPRQCGARTVRAAPPRA